MVPSIYGENMFDDFFDGSFFGGHSPLFGKHARNLMKTDIRETDDAKAYRFAVELPGFEKDEIHVDVNIVKNDILDTEAFRKWMPDYADAEFILEDGKYICGWAVEKM